MDSPRIGLSILITVGIMLALGVVGAVHRGGQNVKSGVPGEGAGGVGLSPLNAAGVAHPLFEPPMAEWDVLTGCQLIENKTDAAHHFHVRRGDDTFVFELYFTAAPETTDSRTEQINEQARYFGLSEFLAESEWSKELRTLGEDAWTRASSLLARKPFVVFTKWEKRPETHHYYGLVYFEDDTGRRCHLQEWLAARGFAIVREPALEKLPDGSQATAFLERLQNQQHRAQQLRVGAWARRQQEPAADTQPPRAR